MDSNSETEPLLQNHSISGSNNNSISPDNSSRIIPPETSLPPNQDNHSSEASKISNEALRWRSIRILYLTMFISSTAFTICISAIWPYLKEVDPNADERFFGWVVAAYSIGQFLASPLFGLLYSKIGNARIVLIVSISIIVIGNIVYVEVESFPFKSRSWVLLISRMVIGFGSGNVAVCRSYLSSVTTISERTSANAFMSASQTLGFILGPAIQTAFAPLGYPGPINLPGFRVNFYTAAGLFGIMASSANILILVILFRDSKLPSSSYNQLSINDNTISSQRSLYPETNSSLTYQQNTVNDMEGSVISDSLVTLRVSTPPSTTNRDYIASITLIFVFFVVLFVFTLLETIATPLTMDEYAWKKQEASVYIGIALAGCGFLSLAVLIGMKFLSKWIEERVLLILSFVFVLCGYIIMLPLSNTPLKVKPFDIDPLNNNSTMKPYISVGCDAVTKPWCQTESQILLYQFILGLTLISIGYPATNLFTYTLFSKVLGESSQGLWMGWLTASGSFARIVGPLCVTFVYTNYGPLWTFSIVAGLVTLTIGVIVSIFYRLNH